jgi:hypothetical protein
MVVFFIRLVSDDTIFAMLSLPKLPVERSGPQSEKQ